MKVLRNLIILSSLVGGAVGATFNDGVYKGGEVAEEIWEDNGRDCDYIKFFQDDVDAYIDKKFVDDGNWQTESYNRGVQAGADQVVEKYEKRCRRRPTPRPTPRRRPTPHPTPRRRPTPRPTPRRRPTPRPTPRRRPTPRPTRKPSGGSNFRAGFNKGQDIAEQIWKDNGSTCAYIWSFQDDVNGDIKKRCDNNSSYCNGVRKGATKTVQEYEKECLEDTSDECDDLGEAAAQEIAFDYCPFSAIAFAPESKPDYKEACREVAYGVCKGAISKQVSANGCDISNNKLQRLQNKCEDQVNMMTGGASPTPRPTPRPTRNRPTPHPTRRPTPRPTRPSGGTSNFRAGFNEGQNIAEDIWDRTYGSDCDYIWVFRDSVDEHLDESCSKDSSFCRGVRTGADKVVQKYEKQCLEDTSDNCSDLGKAAAQEIAFDYCPFSASDLSYVRPDYQESCREAAYSVCQGAVADAVKDNGCSISTNKLLNLQNKCEGQVDFMTGGGNSFVRTIDIDDGAPASSPTEPPHFDWHGYWG